MSAKIPKLTASDLAALLCTRICHDLVNPVGALTAAVEVLDDDNDQDMCKDALELIRLSTAQASAKLQFLRLAFGACGSAPNMIAGDDLKQMVENVYGGGKQTLVWAFEADSLEKPAARLLFNLVILAVQAVPRGGEVRIGCKKTVAGIELELICTGPKARLEESVVKTLAGHGPESGFDGRTVQPFYTGMIARKIGGQVLTNFEGETVVFKARLSTNHLKFSI